MTPKMGRRSHLTQTQRALIVVLQQEGFSECQISARIGCSINADHNAWEKFRKYCSYCDKPKLGRPRKTSKRDDIMIKRVAVRSPTGTTNKIRSELLRKGTIISKRTICRHSNLEWRLESCKPALKPRLTERIKSKHLAFANKYASLSSEL